MNCPPINQSISPSNKPFNLPTVHGNHLSTNCQVHVKREAPLPLEKISSCGSFPCWIYTWPGMGRNSGSTIAMSLPKICPSSNPCLPQKGTPPRAFLQATTCREGVGSLENCPVGTKKVKQIKKEDEMVEQMGKKFGIENNCTNGKTRCNKNKVQGLHDALAGFLSFQWTGHVNMDDAIHVDLGKR